MQKLKEIVARVMEPLKDDMTACKVVVGVPVAALLVMAVVEAVK